MAVFGADAHGPPGRHRVARVDDQIDKRELELSLVGERVPDMVDLPFDVDQAAERVGEEVGDRVLEHGKVD